MLALRDEIATHHDTARVAADMPLPRPVQHDPDAPANGTTAAEARRPAPPPAPPSSLSDLWRARGWVAALRAHDGLPRLGTAALEQARIEEAFVSARNPVARQNLVFLSALTVPLAECEGWLRAVASGEDAADAEDALCALAFSGAGSEKEAFLALARAASAARVHRLLGTCDDHEALGQTGTPEAREVLRSYRCVEVFDREPYFKYTHVAARISWLPHPDRSNGLERELLSAWVDRYPGHPGGDDMAYRVARTYARDMRWAESAVWYARSASLPDQDVSDAAVARLLATAELLMTPEEIDRVAHDRGLDTPNRLLLTSVRIRRVAAERGYAAGLAAAAGHAAAEPRSPIASAYRTRGGEAEAPPDDGLSRGYVDRRLVPRAESRPLSRRMLASQFRSWEEIAALEQAAARASGRARSDLLYRIAARLYHDDRVLFPEYGTSGCSIEWALRVPVARENEAIDRLWQSAKACWYALTLSHARAIALFDEIERSDPGYPALDKVLFSRAMARKHLLGRRSEDDVQRGQIATLVADFESCAARFPEGTLADDSVAAARYWRRTRPDAFAR